MLKMLVNIDVDDVGKAEAFYCGVLGLYPGRRFGSGGVELLGGSSPIYLLEKSKGSKPAPGVAQGRDYTRHWTPVHVDFVVADVEATTHAAQAAGARLEGEIRTHNWGRIAVMADPFGHGFCLIQFLNRGYDEIATG